MYFPFSVSPFKSFREPGPARRRGKRGEIQGLTCDQPWPGGRPWPGCGKSMIRKGISLSSEQKLAKPGWFGPHSIELNALFRCAAATERLGGTRRGGINRNFDVCRP